MGAEVGGQMRGQLGSRWRRGRGGGRSKERVHEREVSSESHGHCVTGKCVRVECARVMVWC